MKKLFFGVMMLAGIGMLVNTACSSSDEPQSGETVAVNLTAALADVAGSRATGDNVDVLYYAVYTSSKAQDGVKEVFTATEVTGSTTSKNSSGNFTLTLDLVKDQTYRVIFWAQNSACEAYIRGDKLEAVTVNYAKELTDAFYGQSGVIKPENVASHTVILTRPFAQLNVNVRDAYKAAQLGYTINSASVTVSEYANVLNLLTGATTTATGSYTATAGALTIDGDASHSLISKLILPTGNDVTVKAGVNSNNIDIEIPNCPLKANYRTNIDGNWLTSSNSFTVTLGDFAGSNDVPVQ